jgi:cytochrome c peroxidase
VPVSIFLRSAWCGPFVAASLGLIGFANLGFGAAIVGETRLSAQGPKATAAIDAMKAEYRRPTLVPFPKENPYTPRESGARQKAVF